MRRARTMSMFPSPLFQRIEESSTLERWIETHPSADFDLPFLVQLGCVYLNHKRIAPRNPAQVQLEPNDLLRIHPQPRRYHRPFDNFKEIIVQETEEYVIFDKPSGVPVHPTLDNLFENLLTWGSQDLGQTLLITHRLDVGTCGLMVYAKTPQAQSRFNKYLKENQVQKIYRAEATRTNSEIKDLDLQPWIHWMKPSYRAPKEVFIEEFLEGIRCETRPRSIEILGDQAKVELELITGRTHQIRSQMSALGFPIDGDQMYGSKINLGLDCWKLRCTQLSFPGHLIVKNESKTKSVSSFSSR